ncbi:Spy/CpxP family protein refolding chaperone [Marinobacter sp. PE14]
MKLQANSRIWLSLAFCLGLSATAFTAHAHEGSEPSASDAEASQPDGGKAAGMQHHYPHGDGYKGHHGANGHSSHHGMGGQGGMHHGMNGYEGMPQRPMMELDLNDEQLQEIAGIQKELRSELRELKVERYEESLKLQELYAEDELDAGDINDQQQKVFDVIKEITELQVEAQQDIRDLLTSEQRTQLQRSGGWLMLN